MTKTIIDKIDIDRYLPRCGVVITEYDDEDGQVITKYSCRNRAVYDVYVYPDDFPELNKTYKVTKCCEEHIEEIKK